MSLIKATSSELRKFAVSVLLLLLSACSDGGSADVSIAQKVQVTPHSASEVAIRRFRTSFDDPALHQQAAEELQSLIGDGDLHAAFLLGRYWHLQSPEPDPEAAMKLYRVAADHGDAWAMNNIGLLYQHGEGVAVDQQRALEWFHRAADSGDSHGYKNLADAYAFGLGVPRSRTEAIATLQRGVDAKIPGVYVLAARMYCCQQYGVTRDLDKGLALLDQAAAAGHEEAGITAANLFLDGEFGARGVSEGIARLRAMMVAGSLPAMERLARAYSKGEGVTEDDQTALALWRRADALGGCRSLEDLGDAYSRGWGVVADAQTATNYYRRAVRCDSEQSAWAEWKLGTRYRFGFGIQPDCEKALYWYAAAAKHGEVRGFVDAGNVYEKSCGAISVDLPKAFTFYLRAAKLGDGLGENNVGAMLKHGYGVTAPDRVKGFAWLTLAAEQGDPTAIGNIRQFGEMFTAADRQRGIDYAQQLRLLLDRSNEGGAKFRADASY